MSVVKVLYQTVLRRPSRFFVVVAVGSLFFERTLDIGIESLYDRMNRGKQWKDIADKYV
ncbi:PREDICTED: cytochrome b-c1 complex subunit 9 [Diuraphis noxia]|uniref:cytochrome b-c1 complex subunit 9 n=1 Tax=Diuraphis noxia TaxID=143948 RepID=UPI00076390BA|nr:PREDICTED: cytochrome b-c1 complex subunit 9 [Diuraphis noxia]